MVRNLATCTFLALLAVLFLVVLRPYPPFIIPFSIALSGLILGLAYYKATWGYLALGFLICTTPTLLPYATSLVIAAFLLARLLRSPISYQANGFLPLVLLSIGSSFLTFAHDFDFLLYSSLWSENALLSYLDRNRESCLVAALRISQYCLAYFLYGLSQKEGCLYFSRFRKGLAFGAVVACLFVIAQSQGWHPYFSIQESPVFREESRLSATFSDPNAFAVMSILLAALLIVSGQGPEKLSGILLLISAVLSTGSRTLSVGLVLFAFIFSDRWWSTKSKLYFSALVIALIAVFGEPRMNDWLRERIELKSLDRVIQSVHWEKGPQLFKSRFVFGELSMQAFSTSPVVGVGLGRFYDVQKEASLKRGIELKGWRDNANNFYLDVLCESGILGAFFVLAAILLFHQELSQSFHLKIAVLLSILLLTGPHIYFEEVLYLSAISLGAGSEQKPRGVLVPLVLSFLFISYLVFLPDITPKARGTYQLEAPTNTVWSSTFARIPICDTGVFRLRAPHPGISVKDPVTVRLTWEKEGREVRHKELIFTDTQWKTIALNELDIGSVVTIDIDHTFSPLEPGVSDDARILGVQMLWGSHFCGNP